MDYTTLVVEIGEGEQRYANTYTVTPEFVAEMGRAKTRARLAEELVYDIKRRYGFSGDPNDARVWEIHPDKPWNPRTYW